MSMCGLAGFQGLLLDAMERAFLMWGLGIGIDRRGGDSFGCVTIGPGESPLVVRDVGKWTEASSLSEIRKIAASHESIAMHARYATCGTKTAADAHPFTIERDGKPVLYGMHNGVLYNTEESAKRHNREHTVDSRELFELLADGLLDEISALEGYGTIVWVLANQPDVVYLAKLSYDADLEIAKARGGGILWGSTKKIVENGLDATNLEVETYYKVESGIAYSVAGGRCFVHEDYKISVASHRAVRVSGTSYGYRSAASDHFSDRFGYDEFMRSVRENARGKGEEEEVEVEITSTIDDDPGDLATVLEEMEIKQDVCAYYGIDPNDPLVEKLNARELEEYLENNWS